MGKMILCRTKEAKKPLVVREMGIRIYTLEELCYFIYNNVKNGGVRYTQDIFIIFTIFYRNEVIML